MPGRTLRLLAALLLLPVAAAAAPAPAPEGLKLLGPAGAYLALKPLPLYGALDEVRRMLPLKHRGMIALLAAGLPRMVGFDPTTPAWLQAAGVDSGAPVLVSALAIDPAAARAAHRFAERRIRAQITAGASATAASAGEPPPTLTTHRIVMKLRDESQARRFLAGLEPRIGRRLVALAGQGGDASATRLGGLLDLEAAPAAALASELSRLGVLAVLRPDRDLVVTLRVREGHAVLDLLEGWLALPAGGALHRSLLAALAFPTRPPGERDGPARLALTDDTILSVFLPARAFLSWAALEGERELLGRASNSRHPGPILARLRAHGACAQRFQSAGRALTGDLLVQLRSGARDLHLRARWSLPGPVRRALGQALTTTDLVDPLAVRGQVLALMGSRLRPGALGRSLARGPFATRMVPFLDQLDSCVPLAPATLALGGWAALPAVLRTEGRRLPLLGPLFDHLEGGVLLLKGWSGPRSPVMLFQVLVAPAGVPRAQQALAQLGRTGQVKPQTISTASGSSVVYASLPPPLARAQLAASAPEPAGQRLTLANQSQVLRWFLGQVASKGNIFPRTLLLYLHVNLHAFLEMMAGGGDRGIPPSVFKNLARRIDQLGSNLSLAQDGMVLEAHLGLQ